MKEIDLNGLTQDEAKRLMEEMRDRSVQIDANSKETFESLSNAARDTICTFYIISSQLMDDDNDIGPMVGILFDAKGSPIEQVYEVEDDPDRLKFVRNLRKAIAEHSPTAYMVVAEAWADKIEGGKEELEEYQRKGLRPSISKTRTEIAMAYFEAFNGEQVHAMCEIIREEPGNEKSQGKLGALQITLSDSETQSGHEHGIQSRFAGHLDAMREHS